MKTLHSNFLTTIPAIFLGICILLSCVRKKEIKEISFEGVKLNIPSESFFKKTAGIDTYTGIIVIQGDTFNLEFGKNIYRLTESLPTILPSSEMANLAKLNGGNLNLENVVFSEYSQEDREELIFAKNFYLRDTINGIEVKIVQPKRIGDGMTGIYIYSLKDNNSFSIYAINLDSTKHLNALHMFTSIRIK